MGCRLLFSKKIKIVRERSVDTMPLAVDLWGGASKSKQLFAENDYH